VMEVMKKSEGSAPRHEREKKLAAMHGDPNVITHGDVLKARGVKMKGEEREISTTVDDQGRIHYMKDPKNPSKQKSSVDDKGRLQFKDTERPNSSSVDDQGRIQFMKDPLAPTPQKSSVDDKGRLQYKDTERSQQSSVDDQGRLQFKGDTAGPQRSSVDSKGRLQFRKESIDTQDYYDIDEASTVRFTTKGADWSDNKNKVTAIHKSLRQAHPDKVAKAFGGGPDNAGYVTVKKKEHLDIVKKHIIKAGGTIKENKDTPGNSYTHQCAIHVKSESFGQGRTITTQHADPDQDGNIAWYDVMFEHGIEKGVPTSELEILVSESHMHSKRKKKGM